MFTAGSRKQKSTTFYCFSPLAMIVTFVLEIILAVYTVCRYKLNPVVRIVIAMLVFLAIFQAAEYMVCKGSPSNALVWSRVGYVSITMLPPLGLNLTLLLAGARRYLQWGALLPAYGTAALFMLFFWLGEGALTGHQCLGNYVIFQISSGKGWFYTAYYYGWILVSLAAGLYYMHYSRLKRQRKALTLLLISYLAFLLPTATVNLLSPGTLSGIPSIMCGFAVVLAVMLVVVVLPAASSKAMRK